VATLFSRILGLVREIVMASLFGTGMVADCFVVAFRIPNLLRRLFGEGTLSAAFVPTYTEVLTQGDQRRSRGLATTVGICLSLLLVVLVILGIFGAPFYIKLFVWGWRSDPAKLGLTVRLAQLLFPYLFFVGLAALAMGILNSHRRFFVPALSPVVLNLFWIMGAIVLGGLLGHSLKEKAFWMGVGILIGGLFQFLIQVPLLFKVGFKPVSPLPLKDEMVVRVGRLMIPGIFGLAVSEINYLVDTFLASLLPAGSVAALQYGNRLMLLPLGIFGVSLATASLPAMSASAAKGDKEGLVKTLSRSLRGIFFFILPTSLLLISLRYPLVRLLFQRGAFSSSLSTPMTAYALGLYSIGLFAYGGVKVVVQAFYSLKDTKTPVKVGALAMGVNIVLSIILMQFLELGGLALATSLAAMLNLGGLLMLLQKKIGDIDGRRVFSSFGRMLLASLLAGGASWGAYRIVQAKVGIAHLVPQLLVFGSGFLAGVGSYLLLVWLFRLEEREFLRLKSLF